MTVSFSGLPDPNPSEGVGRIKKVVGGALAASLALTGFLVASGPAVLGSSGNSDLEVRPDARSALG